MIKTSNGRKLSPIKIEMALKQIDTINDVIVVGHGRKCLAALITLSDELVGPIGDDFLENLKNQIDKMQLHLTDAEKVKCFLVLTDKFTVSGGQLTSSLKLKRNAIERIYQDQIDELYSDWELSVKTQRKSLVLD